MRADVPQPGGSQQGVHQRMYQRVPIAVSCQPRLELHPDAAKPQGNVRLQLVNIVPYAGVESHKSLGPTDRPGFLG